MNIKTIDGPFKDNWVASEPRPMLVWSYTGKEWEHYHATKEGVRQECDCEWEENSAPTKL